MFDQRHQPHDSLVGGYVACDDGDPIEGAKRGEQEILYATNAIAIDECTLHRIHPSTGKILADLGTVTTDDGTNVGIFGMCRHRITTNENSTARLLYAINHLDQLVQLHVEKAEVQVIGNGVGVNGLFDLACHPSNSELVYSYTAVSNQVVVINTTTGLGQVLPSTLPEADAVSMDFDWAGTGMHPQHKIDGSSLWLLQNGKLLSTIDITTGAQLNSTILKGGTGGSLVPVKQRNGSIRRPDRCTRDKNNLLYSTFFEADPSSMWLVDVEDASIKESFATELDAAYALAFLYETSRSEPLQEKP